MKLPGAPLTLPGQAILTNNYRQGQTRGDTKININKSILLYGG